MIVIADTTPLHYLILLDYADILRELYGRVIIPPAVRRELLAPHTPLRVKQWISKMPPWLEVKHVRASQDPALAELDDGEQEAIALAEMLHADALILDDKAARRVAERRRLRVIGTARVLADAAEADLLELPETFDRLQRLGFYLDNTLVEYFLDRQSKRKSR